MLRLDRLTIGYGDGAPVLSEIDLTAEKGEFIVVVGASGCGKTTLLSCIAGFLPPAHGAIEFDGQPIVDPSAERCVVFQGHALMPWLSVLDNVALGLRIGGMAKDRRRARALEQLDLVGLRSIASRRVYQLSGGMRQRVGIARALAADPKLLLMDEPFGALDAMARARLQEQTLRLWRDTHKTVFFITHDVEEALFLATKLVIMAPHPGRIVETIDLPFSRRFASGEDAASLRSDPAFQTMRRQILERIEQSSQHDAAASSGKKPRSGRSLPSLLSAATICVVLALWWITTRTGFVKPLFLPAPSAVMTAFQQAWQGVADGVPLYMQALASLGRVMAAFLLATFLGIPAGLAMGCSRTVRSVLDPLIEFYRPLPPLAYLPLMVIWFGIGETSKIMLILLACFAPVALAARSGVLAASPQQIDAVRSMGATRWQVLRHVLLPAALPDILVGLRIGMGVGWTTLVAAEMVAANAGLGQMVLNASNFLRTDIVVMGIIVIGFFAVSFESGLRWMERRLTPWRGKV